MKVLVTGATGFVGRAVVRELYAAGHGARLLVRDPQSPTVRSLLSKCAAETRAGNVLERETVASAIPGCDAVIHLVGIISEIGGQTYEHVHTQATTNVVAAAQQAGVRRFLHMSALGTRPNAASRYHQTKWAAEEWVRGSKLDWTIFRPSLIYGPDDQFVNLFARMARFSPVLPVMGSGAARFQPIAVDEVARCFVKALAEPQCLGRTLDLCGPQALTLPEMLHAILSATGRRRCILHVPLPLARFQAALLEKLFPPLLHRAPPLNRDQLIMLQEDNTGDPQPTAELFGFKPVRFAEGITRYLTRPS